MAFCPTIGKYREFIVEKHEKHSFIFVICIFIHNFMDVKKRRGYAVNI